MFAYEHPAMKLEGSESASSHADDRTVVCSTVRKIQDILLSCSSNPPADVHLVLMTEGRENDISL